MEIIKKFVILFISVFLSNIALAATTIIVDSPKTGTIGTPVVVNVVASETNNVASTVFRLLYNPEVIIVSNITKGNFLYLNGTKSLESNIGGIVTFVGRIPIESPGIHASGNIATITFIPIKNGTSGLTLNKTLLGDSGNNPISTINTNSLITIGGVKIGDIDDNGVVTLPEVMEYVKLWSLSQVSLTDVIAAITNWAAS